jgi:hypothetical protein
VRCLVRAFSSCSGGYGVLRLLTSPGSHVRRVPISRPRGGWSDAVTAFFVGGRPRYDSPALALALCVHSRYGHRAVSMGMVEVVVSVAVQGFHDADMGHVHFDVDRSPAALDAPLPLSVRGARLPRTEARQTTTTRTRTTMWMSGRRPTNRRCCGKAIEPCAAADRRSSLPFLQLSLASTASAASAALPFAFFAPLDSLRFSLCLASLCLACFFFSPSRSTIVFHSHCPRRFTSTSSFMFDSPIRLRAQSVLTTGREASANGRAGHGQPERTELN